MSDLLDSKLLSKMRDSGETRKTKGLMDEKKHNVKLLFIFLFFSYHFHEKLASFEFDTIMLKLKKNNRVADLKKSGTKIGNFHDPEIFRMNTLYLTSSKRIHMRSYNFDYLFADHKTFRIFCGNHRVTVRLKCRKMIVMKKSSQGTYFQIGTEKTSKLVREK